MPTQSRCAFSSKNGTECSKTQSKKSRRNCSSSNFLLGNIQNLYSPDLRFYHLLSAKSSEFFPCERHPGSVRRPAACRWLLWCATGEAGAGTGAA